MSFAWFLIGVAVGQGMFVFACFLGELLKQRREELEEFEKLHILEERRYKDELH